MPGVLPVLNRRAVELGVRVALALEARVAHTIGFARKNYFYPDLPKGYQITQYAAPLATSGHLDVDVGGTVKRVHIRRIHLEEDAGKTLHVAAAGGGASLVDMNRCGVPLVEIVTDPDVHSIDEAAAFLAELRRLLVFVGATRGRMHEGNLRFDTNVSVRPKGTDVLATQTEIKNLNSFRAVRKALAFEIERQVAAVESGRPVVHETLLWDQRADRVVAMRTKEEVHDYRYFPEPDLPDVVVDEAFVEAVRTAMPELPSEKRARFRNQYRLTEYDASVLTAELDRAAYFEATLDELVRLVAPPSGRRSPDATVGRREGAAGDGGPRGRSPGDQVDLTRLARAAATWVAGVVGALVKERGLVHEELARSGMPPGRLAEIIGASLGGVVSESAAKRLFEEAVDSNEPIDALIERLGLGLVSDGRALRAVVRTVLRQHPAEVERYRAGTRKLFGYFMGEIMRATGGAADPHVASELLRQELDE